MVLFCDISERERSIYRDAPATEMIVQARVAVVTLVLCFSIFDSLASSQQGAQRSFVPLHT